MFIYDAHFESLIRFSLGCFKPKKNKIFLNFRIYFIVILNRHFHEITQYQVTFRTGKKYVQKNKANKINCEMLSIFELKVET